MAQLQDDLKMLDLGSNQRTSDIMNLVGNDVDSSFKHSQKWMTTDNTNSISVGGKDLDDPTTDITVRIEGDGMLLDVMSICIVGDMIMTASGKIINIM